MGVLVGSSFAFPANENNNNSTIEKTHFKEGIHEWDDESDEEIAHEKFGGLEDEEKNVTQKRYFGLINTPNAKNTPEELARLDEIYSYIKRHHHHHHDDDGSDDDSSSHHHHHHHDDNNNNSSSHHHHHHHHDDDDNNNDNGGDNDSSYDSRS